MGRCAQDPISVAGCQCHGDESDCFRLEGSGSSSNPFIVTPKIDDDPDNLFVCGLDGILVKLPDVIANPPRCKLHRSIPQNIDGNLGFQFIDFNVAIFDTASFWDESGDPGQATIPLNGLYEVKFHVGIEPDTAEGNAVRADVMRNLTEKVCYDVRWTSGPGIGTRLRDSTRDGSVLRIPVVNAKEPNGTKVYDARTADGSVS